MEHTKVITVPATTRVAHVKTTCDLCGEVIDHYTSGYDVDEITIERNEGQRYPEGANMTRYDLDMCPKCWVTKLVPWLEEQKVSLRETDTSW